jgi:hypothetical protein
MRPHACAKDEDQRSEDELVVLLLVGGSGHEAEVSVRRFELRQSAPMERIQQASPALATLSLWWGSGAEVRTAAPRICIRRQSQARRDHRGTRHVVTTSGRTALYPYLRKQKPAPPSSKPTGARARRAAGGLLDSFSMKEAGVVIHEGAGRVKGGQGPRVVVRPEWCDGRDAGASVPVIHSAALGGPECLAVLEGSIKWAAAWRMVGCVGDIDNAELARAIAHRRAGWHMVGVADHVLTAVGLIVRTGTRGARQRISPSRKP